jgi:hypothetical protein
VVVLEVAAAQRLVQVVLVTLQLNLHLKVITVVLQPNLILAQVVVALVGWVQTPPAHLLAEMEATVLHHQLQDHL